MRGRESRGPPSADLLVCFPSRAHLTLMPKPICSPARPSEPNKGYHHHNRHRRNMSQSNRGGGPGQASPLMWAKRKPMGHDISEPTSPKVTCAGQIRVRPRSKPSPCKNWQSVMEEMEKIHTNKNKKKPNWVESLGFKKDTLQFLTCLRRIRFDFRCFGSYPSSDLTSDDENEDEEDDEDCKEKQVGIDENGNNSKAAFSKWFMVLQEEREKSKSHTEDEEGGVGLVAECGPPPNALLLMRCRSAPAKSWLEEREEEEREREEEDEESGKLLGVDQEETRSNSLEVVMRCDTDFYKLSCDVAKETWVVGDLRDQLARSRSWKR